MYQQILSTLQFLYIPLNLNLFQSLVLAYRVEVNESFLEFLSRTYRHLKLCSRLKPPSERADYIERNRVAILKQNVPTHVLDTIVNKLRFELGSTQAEAVRRSLYKIFR